MTTALYQQQPDLYPYAQEFENDMALETTLLVENLNDVRAYSRSNVVASDDTFFCIEINQFDEVLFVKYEKLPTHDYKLTRVVSDLQQGFFVAVQNPLVFVCNTNDANIKDYVIFSFTQGNDIIIYVTNQAFDLPANSNAVISTTIHNNTYGMFYDHINNYIYVYACTTNNELEIHRADVSSITLGTGFATVHHKTITGLNIENISYLRCDLACDTNSMYVTFIEGNKLLVAVNVLADAAATELSASQLITESLDLVQPVKSKLRNDTLVLIYGENKEKENIIQIATVKLVRNSVGTAIGPELPHRFTINKETIFNEVHDPLKTNLEFQIAEHPWSGDYLYVAYVSGSDQIRLVKIYNHYDSTKEHYIPLIMWATRLEVFDFYKEPTNNFRLCTDEDGKINVVTYGPDQDVRFFEVNEFICDLGHAQGSITANVGTFQAFLDDITAQYGNAASPIFITESTQNGLLTNLTLKYLDYTSLLTTGIDYITEQLQITLRTIYQNSNIDIFLNDKTTFTISGNATETILSLPRGTTARPCVLRGTEVMKYANNGFVPTMVEQIIDGDYIMNQSGKPVKVLSHHVSVIWSQPHNAPYIIPIHFFGKNKPYKELYISGDHGILVGKEVVYSDNIKILRKFHKKVNIEYHHLLLENHNSNFFIANGLEVDSLHPGSFTRK